MNYLSLYRKYRPHTFKDVVGQEHIVKILKNSIKNNAVANAYVFAGVKGTGKTSIAKIYANAINCLDNKDGDICGNCEVCKDFANNQVMDVIELDAASNNGVEEIRQINDAVYSLPAKLNKKVYIIDEAHMLTNQAWNALLKTVEEPPKHVVFIFATTEMHKIPSTILSRCQCFTFNKITHNDIIKLLTRVCDAEGFKYQPQALNTIADIVDGSARDSLSILEQVATYSNNDIKEQDIYEVYGLLSPKDIVDFLNLLSSDSSDKIFNLANQYFSSGINFVNFANLIVSVLTDKLIYLKTKNYKLLSKTNEVLINSLSINDLNKLMKLLDIWQETYFKVSTPTDVHVIIDHAIIKSLDVFNNNQAEVVAPVKPIVTTKIISKPIEQPKPTAVQTKTEGDFFTCKDFIFEDLKVKKETKPEIKEEIKPEPKAQEPIQNLKLPTEKEILLAVAANKNNKDLEQAKKLLQDLKNGDFEDKALNCCALAKTVFIASSNGIVLVFGDEIDAKILNKNSQKKEFILGCCKLFRNPKFIVGFTAKQLNDMKQEIKDATHHKIPLLNVECLRNILNKDNSTAQLAFNLIYNKLDDKDKI